MLEQAMMTQHTKLLKLTVDFIALLSTDAQNEFRAFSRRRMVGHSSKSHSPQIRKQLAKKVRDMLHLKRIA